MTIQPRLVVLGSTVTALAVVRNAARLGMRPVIVDTDRGVALGTRSADVHVLPGTNDAPVLTVLSNPRFKGRAWLIATSDAWLRFIMRHRAWLEERFASILHPPNETLHVCLDKAAFAQWCAGKGISAPRYFSDAQIAQDGERLPFPLLLRPIESNHSSAAVPKAVEARDASELTHWLNVFQEAGRTPLVTESLLGRHLTQYSVGAAAHQDGRMMTFVAAKRRPLPAVCGVGTFVELCPNDAVERLARDALVTLGYHGIAEVEILRDDDSNRDYLIEINPRPWVQYALGPASRHDLLAFLLDPEIRNTGAAIKTGKRWLNLSTDLYVSFSRASGAVRTGGVPLGSWLSSVLRANTHAHFSWTDPGPACRDFASFARALVRRGRR